MGNIHSYPFPPSICLGLWLEVEKMQSPLLLSLIQEKLKDDGSLHSIYFSPRSSFSHPINQTSCGKSYSTFQDQYPTCVPPPNSDVFFSSPLYERAREQINLNAKQSGWIREDPEIFVSSPQSPQCSSTFSSGDESQTSNAIESPESNSPKTPMMLYKEESVRPPSALLQWPHSGSNGERITLDTYAEHLRQMLTLEIDKPKKQDHPQGNALQRSHSLRNSPSSHRTNVPDFGWDDDGSLKRQNTLRKSMDTARLSNGLNHASNGFGLKSKLRTIGIRKNQSKKYSEAIRFDSIREIESSSSSSFERGNRSDSIHSSSIAQSNTIDQVLAAGSQSNSKTNRMKDRSIALLY